MPAFSTPEPIHALIDIGGISLRVHAVEGGTSTTVEVSPHNPSRSVDVEHARNTSVALVGGRLTLRSPRSTKARLKNLFGSSERVDVVLTLPAGSKLEMRGWGDVNSEGLLGDVDLSTGMGDVDLEAVADIRAKTGMGDVRVTSVRGTADLRTSAGSVAVGQVQGELTAKTSAGDVKVEESQGLARLSTSAGDVRVQRARAGVEARTSAGDVRLGSVSSGRITASTSYGQLEIGIAHGTAAWLDVNARQGVVRSTLEDADGPGDSELTVEIHASTGYGDIVLRRA
ncbi:DUF4097 family beta strand repeat-containing protein [Kineosporia mesophila]|uniref:DUF4097 family beta strand repeat-containing protein n=1 Tax=Kineosporia mesophila TaxID=566012 RepID=A0ABP6ZDY6_9ACTN|nr:DUF4097 family beta strand repeat-containing protein [Kineosporia mesophila]MCD5350259.1 DUF4097 domain-containing protein [Kineosporia mesophila]